MHLFDSEKIARQMNDPREDSAVSECLWDQLLPFQFEGERKNHKLRPVHTKNNNYNRVLNIILAQILKVKVLWAKSPLSIASSVAMYKAQLIQKCKSSYLYEIPDSWMDSD